MKMYYDLTLDFNSILTPQHIALYMEANYGDALCSTNGNVEYDHLDLNMALYSYLAEQFIIEYRQHSDSSAPSELNKIVDELRKQLNESNEDFALHYIIDGLVSNNENLIKKGIYNAFVHNIPVNIKFPNLGTIIPSKNNILEFNPFASIEDSSDPSNKTNYLIEFEIFDGDANSVEEFSDYTLCLSYCIGELLVKYCPYYYFHENSFFTDSVDDLQRLAAKLLCEQHTDLSRVSSDYYDDEDDTTPLERFLDWACKYYPISDDYRKEMLSNPTADDVVDIVYRILSSRDLVMLTSCYAEE